MSYLITKIELERGRDEVIGFWKENFPGWPFKKYGWLYEKNVFGKASCWTLHRGNKVVGSAAIFPRDFTFHGRRLKGGVAGDFGVDRKNRMLGPAISLQRAVADEKQYDFVYGFPNQHSEPIQLKVGFKLLGPVVRMVRVLRTDSYLRQRINSEQLARFSAAIGNLILRARENPNRFDQTIHRVECPEQFDDRFDRLWEKVARTSTTIIGIRNKEFLNRRFVQCPYIDFRIFAVTRRTDNSVLGYLVYRVQDKVLHLSDILVESIDEHFDILVSAFIKHARLTGFHAISVMFLCNETLTRNFRRLAFAMRPHRRNVVICAGQESSLDCDLLDPNKWYLFEADND